MCLVCAHYLKLLFDKLTRGTRGRSTKPLTAQLMRIHVVTPKAPVNVTLNPRVQPAPSPCPIFVTGIQEPVRLSQSSYWILRLPYPFIRCVAYVHIRTYNVLILVYDYELRFLHQLKISFCIQHTSANAPL